MLPTRRDFLRTTAGALGLALLPGFEQSRARPVKTGKPNILLIMADDMGYSDAECYGGEIRTPNLSALAAGGIRFTQHYSTGRCWPSRACILTGYYAQQIRRDEMPGIDRGPRPLWAPLLPELLKPLGYSSYHSGKWHIDGDPRDNGFERSWGRERAGCDWDRYFDSGRWKEDGVSAPVEPGQDYYSTIAIADHAVQCLKLHRKNHSNRPFFQYVAFYSPHFPLHALQKDIESYRDSYLEGWDMIRTRRWKRMKKMGLTDTALSARDTDIVPGWNLSPDELKARIGPGEAARAVGWQELTAEQKKFQATKMAIHAAMITRMDLEIGRIIGQLKQMGAYENTLILFVSDNGASAEQIIRGDGHDPAAPMGSAKSYLCLGPGFSTAANTPFRLHKHWNHEGGISSPLIVHWPKGISARGELRHNPSHFIDIAPTILELAGGAWPKTIDGVPVPPKPGRSLVPAFAADGTVTHENLWWCHQGNRALRIGDWKLVSKSNTKDKWELYNLKVDRCEMNDQASQYPDRVKQMAQQWEAVAEGFRMNLKATPARE
jgi:arylsulfatase